MTGRTQNGWPIIAQNQTVPFVAPNGKTVYCANRDVARVFEWVAARWHRELTPLGPATHNTRPNERTGMVVIHAWRPAGVGGIAASNHGSASAMDINGHLHHYEPQCNSGNCPPWRSHTYYSGFTSAQVTRLRAIGATTLNGARVLRMGHDFPLGTRDGMHVEIAPGVTPAQAARFAAALMPDRVATLLADLDYPTTPTGVIAYQAEHGLTVDGIPGPLTTTHLEATVSRILTAINALDRKVTTQHTAQIAQHGQTRTHVTNTRTAITTAIGRIPTANQIAERVWSYRVPFAKGTTLYNTFGPSWRAGALLGQAALAWARRNQTTTQEGDDQ